MKKLTTLLFILGLSFLVHAQNHALNFDGVDDYVGIPAKSGVANGNDFTVETWWNQWVPYLV